MMPQAIDPNAVLSKKEQHFNITDEIISCCLSTAKAPLLIKHESGGRFPIRGQMHVFLSQPFGTHKSYLLQGINPKLTYHMRNFTLPGLLGTIDQDGNATESAILQAAGKTLIIDEAHKLTTSAVDALNELLEKQKDERSLGFMVKHPMTLHGAKPNAKYAEVHIEKGEIRINKAVFSCLATGLYAKKDNLDQQAFLSRFVFIPIKYTAKEMRELTNGLYSRHVSPIQITKWREFTDYKKFHEIYWDGLERLPFLQMFERYDKLGYIQRNINDALRFILYLEQKQLLAGAKSEKNDQKPTAVKPEKEKHSSVGAERLQNEGGFLYDPPQFEAICPYFYGFLRNLAQARLTATQQHILELLMQDSLTKQEIALDVGIDVRYVQQLALKYHYLLIDKRTNEQ